jgi:hypothetical protein
MSPCPVCGSREPHEHTLPGLVEDVHLSYGVKPEDDGMSEPVMMAVRGAELAWFKAHPDERYYFRRLVKGEAPPDITADWVKVTKRDPEANERKREFYVRQGGEFVIWQDQNRPPKGTIEVTFRSLQRQPKHKPDPRFPTGQDIDISKGAAACTATIPYPAQCCGYYVVHCKHCGETNVLTAAGRADDPRTIKMPCGKR